MKRTISLALVVTALLAVPGAASAAPRDRFDTYRFRAEARREARAAIREAQRTIREARREVFRARFSARAAYRHAYRDAIREARQAAREDHERELAERAKRESARVLEQ